MQSYEIKEKLQEPEVQKRKAQRQMITNWEKYDLKMLALRFSLGAIDS